jgi:hypothetical protein
MNMNMYAENYEKWVAIRLFRIISILSKFCYFRPSDHTYRFEFSLCTLTPEVQCCTFHQNPVIWWTKITKFWQNGNDSKQPYCHPLFIIFHLSIFCKTQISIKLFYLYQRFQYISLTLNVLSFFICGCQEEEYILVFGTSLSVWYQKYINKGRSFSFHDADSATKERKHI